MYALPKRVFVPISCTIVTALLRGDAYSWSFKSQFTLSLLRLRLLENTFGVMFPLYEMMKWKRKLLTAIKEFVYRCAYVQKANRCLMMISMPTYMTHNGATEKFSSLFAVLVCLCFMSRSSFYPNFFWIAPFRTTTIRMTL